MDPLRLTMIRRCCFITLLAFASPTTCSAKGENIPEIQRFFKEHCHACHGATTQKGNVRLDQLNLAKPTVSDRELLKLIGEQLTFQNMPPEEVQQPPRVVVEGIIAWIENRLGAHGET